MTHCCGKTFTMNTATILLILSCATVYAAEGSEKQREREIFKQCFTQVGLDYAKISKEAKIMSDDEFLEKITRYKMGCIGTCFLQKKLDKIPVRQHILNSLDKAESQYPEAEMIEFTYKAKKCIDEAKGDDCALMECLNPWDQRVTDIIGL